MTDARHPSRPPPRTGMRHVTPKNLQTVTATFVLWTLYGLLYSHDLVDPPPGAAPQSWLHALRYTFISVLVCWIPLTLLLVATARRVALSRRTLVSGAAQLAAAIVVVLTLHAAYITAIAPLLEAWQPGTPSPGPHPPFSTVLANSFRYSLVRVLMILAICYAWVHMQDTHANRLRIAELETGLSRARLDALSAQLNPHFLFNALNSIAELIHVDQEAADRMLVALSMLLRRSLSGPGHEVSVQEEAAIVAQYLSIEKIRLGERLQVRWAIDPGCLRALVPALMLQPLAENAIVHGIARRRTPGVVQIAMHRTATMLVIEVSDDGRTSDAPPRETGSGIGLANTQARLRCLYGDDWSLTLHTDDDTRSIVRVELPLRFAAASDGALSLAT